MVLRILGIDPGSRVTGYGLIEVQGCRHRYIDCGCIRVGGDALAERLGMIFNAVRGLIEEHKPTVMAVESVFVADNAGTALKLGQARGAAICAGASLALPIAEYAPRSVKQAIVGRGAAEKGQVQHMVTALLKLERSPSADAADALAIAICHAHHASSAILRRAGITSGWRR